MGITDSKAWEKWQEFNKAAEDTPALYLLADALGYTGEEGLINKKIPAMWESYEKPYKQLPKDIGIHGANLFGEAADLFGAGITGLKELGKIGPLTPGDPEGFGAAKTEMMDTLGNSFFGDIFNVDPTDMEKDYGEAWEKYAHPDHAKWLSEPITDENSQAYVNKIHSLDDWDMYQYWKDGSGWDNADDRRIDKRVEATMKNKAIPPGVALQDFYKLARENMDTPLGENGVTGAELVASPEAVNYYFKQYFDGVKETARKGLKNEFEFEATGKDYGKWASRQYQDEMLNKYGRYQLYEGDVLFQGGEIIPALDMMSQNLDPYFKEGSTMNFANDAYIKELKKGTEYVGKPTEFDYGAWDKNEEPGGLSKDYWYDYTTPEAEKVFESPQLLGAEIIGSMGVAAPLKVRKALKPASKWLNKSSTGRILREVMPGTFQWGSRKNFGIPKVDHKGWKKLINWTTGTIDFARPKFGQLGGAMALSELMDRD